MKYLSVIILLIMYSCSKNNCDTSLENVDFIISDESKAYISQYKDKSKAKFVDSNGDTKEFTIKYFDDIEEYEFSVPCTEDQSETQLQTGEKQYIEVELYNSIFDKPLVLILSQTLNTEREEMLVVSKGNYRLDLEDAELLLGVNTPIEDSENSIIDSISINGETYYEVIEGMNETNSLNLKYNKEFGVFYIKDEILNLELILTEIE